MRLAAEDLLSGSLVCKRFHQLINEKIHKNQLGQGLICRLHYFENKIIPKTHLTYNEPINRWDGIYIEQIGAWFNVDIFKDDGKNCLHLWIISKTDRRTKIFRDLPIDLPNRYTKTYHWFDTNLIVHCDYTTVCIDLMNLELSYHSTTKIIDHFRIYCNICKEIFPNKRLNTLPHVTKFPQTKLFLVNLDNLIRNEVKIVAFLDQKFLRFVPFEDRYVFCLHDVPMIYDVLLNVRYIITENEMIFSIQSRYSEQQQCLRLVQDTIPSNNKFHVMINYQRWFLLEKIVKPQTMTWKITQTSINPNEHNWCFCDSEKRAKLIRSREHYRQSE